jgi:hypothetical protein
MTKTTISKVRAGELLFDYRFYPRQKINEFHVGRFVMALKMKKTVPPIIVDIESKRIVDGFHRTKAYITVYGEGVIVSAILKKYSNEAEMFKDAILQNASHGLALSIFDIGRTLVLAENFNIQVSQLCAMLGITEQKAEKILNRIKPTKKNKEKIYIKTGLEKLVKQKNITDAQKSVNEHALGIAPLRLANDLLGRIKENCIIYSKDLLFVLTELRDAINIVLATHKEDDNGE